MLNMVANIECEEIEWTIIRISFKPWFEYIMLCDEMRCEWVPSKTQKIREEEIVEGLISCIMNEETVEANLDNPVENFPPGRLFWVEDKWSECIEDWLEKNPY